MLLSVVTIFEMNSPFQWVRSLLKEEKIHDLNLQPRTCSHPINARTLTGVCRAVRMFSSCIFQVSISIGTFCESPEERMIFLIFVSL